MMTLIQHHIKYKEIHGVDEVVWMRKGDHLNLHIRLRKEGKCNIPKETLNLISQKAHRRTSRSIERCKNSDGRKYTFQFFEAVIPYVQLVESVRYNLDNGNVYVSSYFQATKHKELWGLN